MRRILTLIAVFIGLSLPAFPLDMTRYDLPLDFAQLFTARRGINLPVSHGAALEDVQIAYTQAKERADLMFDMLLQAENDLQNPFLSETEKNHYLGALRNLKEKVDHEVLGLKVQLAQVKRLYPAHENPIRAHKVSIWERLITHLEQASAQIGSLILY